MMQVETREDAARRAVTTVRGLASALFSVPRKYPVSWAVAWTILLVALILAPSSVLPDEETIAVKPFFPPPDSVIHFALFTGFVMSWLQVGRSRRWQLTLAAIAVILAVATEFAQGLPWIHRDPELRDGIADCAGALVGFVAAATLDRRRWPGLAEQYLDPASGDPPAGSK
jgi:hypothetical protein